MQTVNALLQAPDHKTFVLVQEPHKQSIGLEPTTAPIADFTTGFDGWSADQIRNFLVKNVSKPLKKSLVEPRLYAILDAKSDQTRTVILGFEFSPLVMRDPDSMTEEEVDQWEIECDNSREDENDLRWREWRVSFQNSLDVIRELGIPTDFQPKLFNDAFVSRYTDQEGVFEVHRAKKAWMEEQVATE